MSERYSEVLPPDLHSAPALQEVAVRESVRLTPLSEDHAEPLLETLSADPSIRDRVAVASKIHTKEDVQKEIERYHNDPALIRYSLFVEQQYAGLVSLWNDDGMFGMPPDPTAFGFGYFLNPDYRGKGLVTDSIKALMEATQKNFKVTQFIAFCEDDNRDSIKLLKKMGFDPEGEVLPDEKSGWIARKYIAKI